MKIICSKTNLVKGVSIVSKAVPSKTTMPILECILIDATTDIIKFTANDMELGIETIVEGEILKKGMIAIDARIFSEIVRKLPDNNITIETDDNNKTTITCEKSKFNIIGKSGDDFSCLPITYTYQNAIFSRKRTDMLGLQIRRAIICCMPVHARRSRMYYETLFPDAELLVCPAPGAGITRSSWLHTEEGIDTVLGEMERCGGQHG